MLSVKDYLPIGSVVLLKNGIKKAMIIGIMHPSKVGEEYVEHDYVGVLYPEGFLTMQTMFMFNHNQITDVIYRGYDNPERTEFMARVEKNVNLSAEELQNRFREILNKQKSEESSPSSTPKTSVEDIF